jgi:hypothetical protein
MTADNTSLRAQVPLIVSLTTLPSRIHLLRPTLDSLASQTHKPDGIFLCLPRWSTREQCAYERPSWLSAYEPLVRIVPCDEDYGPGTKLLGCLPHLPNPCCLVIVDDDLVYRPFVLKVLYERQMADIRSSFSFCTDPMPPVRPSVNEVIVEVGQGADGFSFFSSNLDGIIQYAETVLQNPHLRLVDDLWISAFLSLKGIPVRGLAQELPPNEVVYEVSHATNQLRHLGGHQQRDQLMQLGLQHLLAIGMIKPVPRHLNVAIKGWNSIPRC